MINLLAISIEAIISFIIGLFATKLFGKKWSNILTVVFVSPFLITIFSGMLNASNRTLPENTEVIYNMFPDFFYNIILLMFSALIGVIFASFLGKDPQDYL